MRDSYAKISVAPPREAGTGQRVRPEFATTLLAVLSNDLGLEQLSAATVTSEQQAVAAAAWGHQVRRAGITGP